MKSNVCIISLQVLLYHVVSGKVTSDMITNDAVVPTVEGSIHRVNVYLKSDYYDVRCTEALCYNTLPLFLTQGFVTVNGKRIKTFDIHASNGVIHLLTDVIYPFIPDQTIAEIVSTDPRLFEEIQIFHVNQNLCTSLGQKNKILEFFFGHRRACSGWLGEPKKLFSNL